jgi:hypothetical protein
MGQAKKIALAIFAAALLLNTASCAKMFDPFNLTGIAGDDSDEDAEGSAAEETAAAAPAKTYAVAPGGVAGGRDELVIYDETGAVADLGGKTIVFSADNDNIQLEFRDGFTDFGTGSGAKIVPLKVGTTIVSYTVDGTASDDKYKVVIPPQSLIQILIGEARGQIAGEAQVEDGLVSLDSASPTANAVAAVVRNRVLLLESGYPTSLFVVNEGDWGLDPPESHWDAVIVAESYGAYQFTPVDPSSESNAVFLNAVKRENLYSDDDLIAYDQAVLTAAQVFDNETADPTGGAFAFRTPTEWQAACLLATMNTKLLILPPECGPGDENYPAFAPIQVLIHPSVAELSETRPSFVFIRNRDLTDPAVTNAP